MSEQTRLKKQGESKSKKEQATQRGRKDWTANVDKPGVHQEKKGSDSFDKDLKRSS